MFWPAKLVRFYYFFLPATKRLSLMGWVLAEMFYEATHMCHLVFKLNKNKAICSSQKVGIGSNHKSPFTLIFYMLKGRIWKYCSYLPHFSNLGVLLFICFPFGPNRKILTLLTRGSSDLTLPFHVLEIDIEGEKSKRSRRSVKSITFVGTSSALTLGHFR